MSGPFGFMNVCIYQNKQTNFLMRSFHPVIISLHSFKIHFISQQLIPSLCMKVSLKKEVVTLKKQLN